MSPPTIPPLRQVMAALLLLAGACGPVPTYARLEASGGEPGSGGAGSMDGGASSGGSGSGGVASSGGQATGGAGGTGGRIEPGSGGVATGGASPGTGGMSPRTGGAPAATGGAGSVGGGSGGTVVGTGGSKVGTGGSGTGTGGAVAGSGGAGSADGGAMVPVDPSNYGFETSVQGWGMAGGGSAWSRIACSTAFSFAGTSSLAASVAAQPSMTYILEVAPPTPAIPAGATVSFHLRLPSTAMLNGIQAYVMETGTYRFTATRVTGTDLARNTWVKVDVSVPQDAAAILRLGVQFESSGTWTDTVYLDAIDW